MLRVRTIYARSALAAVEYYTRYLTEAPGEIPGKWRGAQAIGLGLGGDVGADDLLAILEGHDPETGTPLGRALRDRELADGTVVKAVAGFDATFSTPKSLSVLWALTRDERLLDAHDVAVNAALAHLEHFGSTTRVRSADGRLHPDSQGLTVAAFRQTTSRADDPQIHTHCVISAKVQTDGGRWLALDARYLKRHQRMLGGLYQSVLRNELTHRFGIDWGAIEHGQAEMTAMPEHLLAVVSKRADEINDALAVKVEDFATRQGREPNQWELGALKREAAVDTRAQKSGNGVADLTTRWDAEAASVGWDDLDLVDALNAQQVDRSKRPPTITVEELINSLSASGSTWNRAQIIAALTDIARPDPSLTGEQWAERIEHWADAVISHCVELDPADSTTPRRTSDGRSLHHEPISPHITTEAILAEEELIASWALAAQADDPQPSTTVDVEHLDVLQAHVASAVAGHDRLVLVVGPAGAGKTTILRAAIDDLHDAGRPVFGVAPSAKGARVLKRETGIDTDTLDKLLHEHKRTDRPPLDQYRLPAGTTVIVDEAGMVGTHSLAALTRLADTSRWRVALVGDGHQLQAVGRGGMFHELSLTGRVHALDRIHRFTEDWEAAASLKLRRGDSRALDDYIAHDRVIPGTFDEQLTLIVDRWRQTHDAGQTLAITASSNDHVDRINAAIQSARADAGDVDTKNLAPIAGGEFACTGDVIVTRRNDRRLTTTTTDLVRNRETWTVTSIGTDRSITASSNEGSGVVVLPSEYAIEHVHLGYAATEHGNQGDTTTAAIELVSDATSRRGLYVGATRGRTENLMLVVTESHDLDEARDVLERVLTNDRVDLPAIAQRRELADATRPSRRKPAPQARCTVPDWFDDLSNRLAASLARAEQADRRIDEMEDRLHSELDSARRRLVEVQRLLDPFVPALDEARGHVEKAQQQVWSSNSALNQARGLKRPGARRAAAKADSDLADAWARLADIEETARPATEAVNAVHDEIRLTEKAIKNVPLRREFALNFVNPEHLRNLARGSRTGTAGPLAAQVRSNNSTGRSRILPPAGTSTHPQSTPSLHRSPTGLTSTYQIEHARRTDRSTLKVRASTSGCRDERCDTHRSQWVTCGPATRLGPSRPPTSEVVWEAPMAANQRIVERQLSFDLGEEIDDNVFEIDEKGQHGEVFTRRWVVDLILDLAGYTADRDLGAMVAVEPSCGAGAFLVPMVERLIESCLTHGRDLDGVGEALHAFDLLAANVELAQKAVAKALTDADVEARLASTIAQHAVRSADFLLTEHDAADFVIGNPPYIRLEDVPKARSDAYRRACPTMRGRSDIFVGFIETGLRLLKPDGTLGFIVADRWMHNQYGSDLRKFIADGYSVETVLTMHDVDAFDDKVSAYPAITVIRRAEQSTAVVANASGTFDESNAPAFRNWADSRSQSKSTKAVTAVKLPTWFDSASSWPSGNPANLALLADLESRFEPLEDPQTGTRVGIGVATGADSVYLTADPDLVEPDRLLPMLMTRDTTSGEPRWSGTYMVNPWDDGKLVSLDEYPRMRRYLESWNGEVHGRHVARKNPARWYRTIDRVEPGLLERPKLVIPDLKAYINPVLDRGETYPHHSFYVITSDEWDLEVLGGLLLSDIAELFVAMYCVKMRGGCYRFQAQYLRRIRVPAFQSIRSRDREQLRIAFAERDRERAGRVARRLYGLPAELVVDGARNATVATVR